MLRYSVHYEFISAWNTRPVTIVVCKAVHVCSKLLPSNFMDFRNTFPWFQRISYEGNCGRGGQKQHQANYECYRRHKNVDDGDEHETDQFKISSEDDGSVGHQDVTVDVLRNSDNGDGGDTKGADEGWPNTTDSEDHSDEKTDSAHDCQC